MAIFIDQNTKIKNIFVNVNGKKKSISSAWVNKDGVPTKVFQIDNNEVAPDNEYNNWIYTLDEENDVIILNYYIGSALNVIVYANYKINGKSYKTRLASYGENGTTNYKYMFYGKSNIETIKFSKAIDTSTMKNMRTMFYNCSSLTNIDLTSFDTSNVTDMTRMFYNCANLSKIYVTNGKWSTSKALTPSMFTYCGTSSVTYK